MMTDAITGELCIWTVYEKPTDYPTEFVARLFVGMRPTNMALFGATLDEVRAKLVLADPELRCLVRNERDEPHIVETWF